eukprot:TRINITY_DN93107_c0_g1_i1.p1 TRINITY_DN93107_c0_g1~~TRINITY_DN93107_c0_g1_i1.p1  ORF type:complete len:358 (+),score=69.29 TRINITY_DN93107_c0_g1_i1:89-1162(+)
MAQILAWLFFQVGTAAADVAIGPLGNYDSASGIYRFFLKSEAQVIKLKTTGEPQLFKNTASVASPLALLANLERKIEQGMLKLCTYMENLPMHKPRSWQSQPKGFQRLNSLAWRFMASAFCLSICSFLATQAFRRRQKRITSQKRRMHRIKMIAEGTPRTPKLSRQDAMQSVRRRLLDKAAATSRDPTVQTALAEARAAVQRAAGEQSEGGSPALADATSPRSRKQQVLLQKLLIAKRSHAASRTDSSSLPPLAEGAFTFQTSEEAVSDGQVARQSLSPVEKKAFALLAASKSETLRQKAEKTRSCLHASKGALLQEDVCSKLTEGDSSDASTSSPCNGQSSVLDMLDFAVGEYDEP